MRKERKRLARQALRGGCGIRGSDKNYALLHAAITSPAICQ